METETNTKPCTATLEDVYFLKGMNEAQAILNAHARSLDGADWYRTEPLIVGINLIQKAIDFRMGELGIQR